MSLEATLARIAAIETALYPTPPKRAASPPPRPPTGPPPPNSAPPRSSAYVSPSSASSQTFSQLLGQATLGGTLAPRPATTTTAASRRPRRGRSRPHPGRPGRDAAGLQRIAADQPNTAAPSQGAVVGPWCADFASWCAAQAGIPLGDNGEGFQSVSALWSWAEASGRAVPATRGTPEAGDLIVWGARPRRDRRIGRPRRHDPHDRGQLLRRSRPADLPRRATAARPATCASDDATCPRPRAAGGRRRPFVLGAPPRAGAARRCRSACRSPPSTPNGRSPGPASPPCCAAEMIEVVLPEEEGRDHRSAHAPTSSCSPASPPSASSP